MENYARPRVIRGTRAKPLPLLPSGSGGVHSRSLHEARGLTTTHATTGQVSLKFSVQDVLSSVERPLIPACPAAGSRPRSGDRYGPGQSAGQS